MIRSILDLCNVSIYSKKKKLLQKETRHEDKFLLKQTIDKNVKSEYLEEDKFHKECKIISTPKSVGTTRRGSSWIEYALAAPTFSLSDATNSNLTIR